MDRIVVWLAATLALLTVGCGDLPSLDGRTATSAPTDTEATRIGTAVAPHAAANAGKSGIFALARGPDAFAARALLAAAAERTLDAQYYIWHGDSTGHLLFEALWQAAERGVRVRLLLDDNNTAGLDQTIAALDGHRNIAVRLYNPLVHRRFRLLNYVTDFARVNRRMHNKSLTADNQATIVGGRNIGDEYFGAGSGVAFKDLDVLAVGPIVREVSKAFDLYWNSASAYPAASLVGRAAADAAAALAAKFKAVRADPQSVAYLKVVDETMVVSDLLAGRLPLEWTTARLLHDDPAKTLDSSGRTDVLLLSAMLRAAGRPEQSFDLVSPYLVPGREGTAALAALSQRKVRVRILTNSLAATDVSAVHAGYAKRREDLLRAGVRLYELAPSSLAREETPDATRRLTGSSSASLHAKTFALDGRRIFVGSFNFDERSALLNTEMGLLVDSPRLAGRLVESFDSEVPKAAYEAVLTSDRGDLEWLEQTGAGEQRHDTEPGTGVLLRAWVAFLSILPIDWLL